MKGKFYLSPAQVIALGFLFIILLGALLLSLPFASHGHTSFVDALFTATSATCVTGLTTLVTAEHWTLFGKLVILLLIQIGGLGFMTFISLSAIIAKKRIGLHERQLLVQTTGSLEMNGVFLLIKRIVFGTVLFEGCGALILTIRFFTLGFSFPKSAFYGIFHSVSAFCNAGFDILGDSSFTDYSGDFVMLITLALLIIIGGVGFIVWSDFNENGFKLKKYRLHSKIVLASTVILILSGTLILYLTERNGAFGGMGESEKWLNAFFQSTTLRTAGFASVNQGSLSSGSSVLSTLFMLIGGSPGSTAGGIKTVTVTVAVLNAISFSRNKDCVNIFKKRIDDATVKQASAIITIYLFVLFAVIIAISLLEGASASTDAIIFEVASAIGTVGLSKGITPFLTHGSKLLICFTMFFGRLGGLTLLLALAQKKRASRIERPYEKILIG